MAFTSTLLLTGSKALRDLFNAVKTELLARDTYNNGSESPAAAGTGAISLAVRNSYMSLDGTDAWTMAAPTFPGQEKFIQVVAGANTPVLALTVTGMRVAGANVFTSGTWADPNGPLGLLFRSSNGTSWDQPIMIGSWTIS